MKALLVELRAALAAVADPSRAPAMQAYMKSVMPYHGVAAPIAHKVYQAVFTDLRFESPKEWRDAIMALWNGATYREERYGAIALCAHRAATMFQTVDAVPLYEVLVTTGAWWDYVDDIAANRVGTILRQFPEPTKKILLQWSHCENLWKRRTAILSQLKFETATDVDFLYSCIEPSIESKEFFLRKAIGWALRQYAWTNPKEVTRYVAGHSDRLSPLSKREALKNVRQTTNASG